MSRDGTTIVTVTARCAGCGACLLTCPEHAIRPYGGTLLIRDDLCTGCAECMEVCPVDAIDFNVIGGEAIGRDVIGGDVIDGDVIDGDVIGWEAIGFNVIDRGGGDCGIAVECDSAGVGLE